VIKEKTVSVNNNLQPEAPETLIPEVPETAWDRVKLARHAARPHALDYINKMCRSFFELRGDRRFGDDHALVGGLAFFEGRQVVVLGHQKGKDTRENLERNFGMPRAEGYRKALRLFRLAEKFGYPVLCFIDTPGAYPGLESEERGVAQAIAENLLVMSELVVPVIAVVVGEGGSGGALGIGLADRILMLENAIYSVASPEAAASILWHDAGQAPAAATALKITAAELHELGLVDEVIPEPAGGAHTSISAMLDILRPVLKRHLNELEQEMKAGVNGLLEKRYQKYRSIGAFHQAIPGL
jgi:acetyl-CoA carboxylase carboxyl transferase subunit alpha